MKDLDLNQPINTDIHKNEQIFRKVFENADDIIYRLSLIHIFFTINVYFFTFGFINKVYANNNIIGYFKSLKHKMCIRDS